MGKARLCGRDERPAVATETTTPDETRNPLV